VDDRPGDGAGLTVRGGRPGDAPFVVALGAVAFARFGEYASVMTSFLASPEVAVFVALRGGEKAGFALVDRGPASLGFVDLVAIAVEAGQRRAGVGRALLTQVIAWCTARGEAPVLVLTIADDNPAAIALFREMGFTTLPGEPGRYALGQRSLRMARGI